MAYVSEVIGGQWSVTDTLEIELAKGNDYER
jgi:hypothetical protein